MGLFSWIKSRPAATTGAIKKKVNKVIPVREITMGKNDIVRYFDALKPKNVRQETFEAAMTRLGLSSDDLKAAYAVQLIRFRIFVSFMVVIFAYTGYFSVTKGLIWALPPISFSLVLLALAASASFRMAQIAKRELFPVSVWLSDSDLWWPASRLPSRKSSKKH